MTGKLKDNPKVLVLLLAAVVVLGTGLAYAYWPTTPPTMPETMADVKALLEDKNYKNLSTQQKRPYIEKVSELMRNSDREARRGLADSDVARDNMRDMFRTMMVDRARQFALADPATREQMIQEDLARFGGFGGPGGRPGGRGEGDGSRGDGPRGPGGEASREGRPEPTEEERAERRKERENRVEEWVNEGNGQEWALIREYWMQVRQRREGSR